MVSEGVYGETFRNRLKWVAKLKGQQGVDRILQRTREAGATLPDREEAIGAMRIYPLGDNDLFLEVALEELGDEGFDRMGQEVAHGVGLDGVVARYDAPLRILAANIETYWAAHYSTGTIATTTNDLGHLVIELTGFAGGPLVCRHLANYFVGVGRATGSTSRVEHITCRHDGGETCRWDIQYQDG